MISIKIAIIWRNASTITLYHFTHCKILVLMIVIIGLCEVIRIYQKHLKSGNPLTFTVHLGIKYQ